MSSNKATQQHGENKMTNISIEARKIIIDLLTKGHTLYDIILAMEDGAYLKEAGISQELSEEIHNFCLINKNYK